MPSSASLEISSEAVRHPPEIVKQAYPDMGWRQMADFGNPGRHAYPRLDPVAVWRLIENEIPILESRDDCGPSVVAGR